MNGDAHRAKAARIERSLAKLGPDDVEMRIEGAMLAGTHWFNVVLHARGLRAETNDAMHAEFVSAAERRKLALLAGPELAALDEIEALRTTHVRGNMPQAREAGERVLALLALLRASAAATPA